MSAHYGHRLRHEYSIVRASNSANQHDRGDLIRRGAKTTGSNPEREATVRGGS